MKTAEQYDPRRDFTTLGAWIKARELKLFLYKEILPHPPPDERYNLNMQIR